MQRGGIAFGRKGTQNKQGKRKKTGIAPGKTLI
jgi:hypothetical protein